MNLSRATDILQENGISHTLIAPHVIRIHWLVDGSSQPVADFDVKFNFTRLIGRFQEMTGKDKGTLKNVVNRLKMINTH